MPDTLTIIKLKCRNIPDLTPEKLVKITNYFQRLVNEKVFEMRNGKVILNFDDERLREIEFRKKVWKYKKT